MKKIFKVAVLGSPNSRGNVIPPEVLEQMARQANKRISTFIYRNEEDAKQRRFAIGWVQKWQVQEGLLIATVNIWEPKDLPDDKIPALYYEGGFGSDENTLIHGRVIDLRLADRSKTGAKVIEESEKIS